jgi:predicted AAA+ superfamily ATPase
VVNECVRRLDYTFPETRLFFWRTHNGAEVDLLFERHGKLRLAAEIKSGRTVSSADLSGLRSFAEAHPKVPRAVVATVPETFRVGDVDVLPWSEFFARLSRWLDG